MLLTNQICQFDEYFQFPLQLIYIAGGQGEFINRYSDLLQTLWKHKLTY